MPHPVQQRISRAGGVGRHQLPSTRVRRPRVLSAARIPAPFCRWRRWRSHWRALAAFERSDPHGTIHHPDILYPGGVLARRQRRFENIGILYLQQLLVKLYFSSLRREKSFLLAFCFCVFQGASSSARRAFWYSTSEAWCCFPALLELSCISIFDFCWRRILHRYITRTIYIRRIYD